MRYLIPFVVALLFTVSCSNATTVEAAQPIPPTAVESPTSTPPAPTAPPTPVPPTPGPPTPAALAPDGTELDLRSALLPLTTVRIPHESRIADSGLYAHPGQNPADDCDGLLRGQAHEQLRFADVEFRWYELGLAIDQELADYGDPALASTHIAQFSSLGDQCTSAMLGCTGCGLSEDGSFDRLNTITPLDTGVTGVVAFHFLRIEDGASEWRALYQRGPVVASLSMTLDPTAPGARLEQSLLAFNQTTGLMVDALDQAATRPTAPPWPEPYDIGDFNVELRAVEIDELDGAWVDYRGHQNSTATYASFGSNGEIVDSVSILLIDDEHDPEDVDYTLGDYSYFDDETTVGGQQAISMPWFDSEQEHSKGHLLVWDAAPESYGWMQSRTMTLDEMRAAAAGLTVTGLDFEWVNPVAGMKPVTSVVFTNEVEDFLRRSGTSASYDISWETSDDSEDAEMTVGFFSLLDGEIGVIRSLAFTEEQVDVRGTIGYLLQVEPASEFSDGEYYLVWQEDEATVAIATVDHAKAGHLLVPVADRFDRDRPYD